MSTEIRLWPIPSDRPVIKSHNFMQSDTFQLDTWAAEHPDTIKLKTFFFASFDTNSK